MEWIRINDDGEAELVAEEIKLVSELQALHTLNYNKAKGDLDGRLRKRMKTELKYMYLMYSYRSPYADYNETERKAEVLIDCNLPTDWRESKELQAAIEKYKRGTPNKILRLLKTTEKFVDKFEVHLNNIELDERKPSGDLVHSPKMIMDTLQKLPALAATLTELGNQAKLGHIGTRTSRGDAELGWTAINPNATRDIKAREDDEETED